MTGGASGIVQIVSVDILNANSELKPKVILDLSSFTNNIVHEGYYTLYGIPMITFLIIVRLYQRLKITLII